MKKVNWPTFSTDGKPRLGLDNLVKFLDKIDNPEDKIPPVFHVAGTNGKGSTTAFIKAILEADGYKVHRFISPHLIDVNERIEIAGKIITDKYLSELSKECEELDRQHNGNVSYFEGQMVMALLAFMRNPADATILEVGLGGRLDATNVIKNPLVSVITSLSYDHTKILGDTIDRIAFEKAGIIKNGGSAVLGKQENELVYRFFEIVAKSRKVTLNEYDRDWRIEDDDSGFDFVGFGKKIHLPTPSLVGKHQIFNAGNAVAALLSQDKIKISNDALAVGIKNAKWAGRLQLVENTKLNEILPDNFQLWLDGAHNEGASTIIKNWIGEKREDEKIFLVIGMLARKNSHDFVLNLKDIVDYTVAVNIHDGDESKSSEDLRKELEDFGIKNSFCEENFLDALSMIGKNFTGVKKAKVLICGSLHLVGEVLEYLRDIK